MSKKIIVEKISAPTIEMGDIKGSPEDIMKLFREEQLRIAEQYSIADPATITFKAEYYGYDGGTDMMAEFPREETDAEYAARLKKERAEAIRIGKKEAKEYEQYLKLKAKFGE